MYQEERLENGLRVLLVPIEGFQSVSFGVFTKIGSRYENEVNSGASHFVEHMLFKGTKQRPTARMIAEAIEGVGGVSNAYTSQETTVYYAKVAASQIGVALDVLTDLVRYPLFVLAEIEKERYVIGEELNMVYDSPEEWVTILLDQVMWPGHPLGQNVAGTHESLLNLSQESLVSFYQASYHPGNVLVAVGGAFEPAEVLGQLRERLGDWQPAGRPDYREAPAAQTQARWHIEDRPIEQGHLCLATPALSRAAPDRYALAVFNAILGEGMSSRLFLQIREEQGLAYAVDSGLDFLQDTGSFVVYAGVDPERAAQALQSILDELARLRDELVPAEELHKAKEYLKGRLVLGLEESFSRTSWIAYQAMFMDSIKDVDEVLQAFEAVTREEVQAVARKIIRPTAYNLAAVGPFGLGDDLARLIAG